MKNVYEPPVLELVELKIDDIVCASVCGFLGNEITDEDDFD